jgi:hypothetical protein
MQAQAAEFSGYTGKFRCFFEICGLELRTQSRAAGACALSAEKRQDFPGGHGKGPVRRCQTRLAKNLGM